MEAQGWNRLEGALHLTPAWNWRGGGALGGDVLHYEEKCVRISFKTSGVDESRCPGWSPEEPQWRDRMGP